MRIRLTFCLLVAAVLIRAADAHVPPPEESVTIRCGIADVSGSLLLPHVHGKVTCVLIVGGTLSDLRDGDFLRKGAPERDALKRIARKLRAAGYASFRYDKVGFGGSRPGSDWSGSYCDRSRIVNCLLEHLRADDRIDSVIVAGESSGAYVACLAAEGAPQADAYAFLGAFAGTSRELYEYNHVRMLELSKEENELGEWLRTNAEAELAVAASLDAVFQAVRRGDASIPLEYNGFGFRYELDRRREEVEKPPLDMFAAIDRPVLLLQGERDLNVPPEHARRAARILREAGNSHVSLAMIPEADHNFQMAPDDEAFALRERFTLASFQRPWSGDLYAELTKWIGEVAGDSEAADGKRKKAAVVEEVPAILMERNDAEWISGMDIGIDRADAPIPVTGGHRIMLRYRIRGVRRGESCDVLLRIAAFNGEEWRGDSRDNFIHAGDEWVSASIQYLVPDGADRINPSVRMHSLSGAVWIAEFEARDLTAHTDFAVSGTDFASEPEKEDEIAGGWRAFNNNGLSKALFERTTVSVESPEAEKLRFTGRTGGYVSSRTAWTPERIELAPGVEIVRDITDKRLTTGVVTLEGRIGPLLLGEGSQAHFLEMPPGMYVDAHSHDSESIIYTVAGRWVLAAGGERILMEPGSLFRFGTGMATGYEVPFRTEASILVFKGDRLARSEKDFIDYLRGMAGGVRQAHREGVPFFLVELPDNHPARVFAREVNPSFEEEFGAMYDFRTD